MTRNRSAHSPSPGLSFSKPFLALLQVFIEQHGQVPDHERQHNPGEELGRVSKLCFQCRPQLLRERGVGRSYWHRRYRLRVFIQQLRLEK